MRVLHVHSGNLYGGVETLLVTLARDRDLCRSMEPHFALCFKGRLSEELADVGACVHDLGEVRVRNPLSVWRARRKLKGILREHKIDIVVCHSTWPQAIFGSVARAAGLPLVNWLHAAVNNHHWLQLWARLTPPDLALCNSRFTLSTLRKLYPKVSSQLMYCPVTAPSPPASETEQQAMRAELNAPMQATIIVHSSRTEALKGHRLLLQALAMLKEMPGWAAWIVGGAQRPHELRYLNSLKELATTLGLADRITFVGQRSDVLQILAAADIYCQPNTGPEAFGIAFVEALYVGIPVVTTRMGGAQEIVDESCGILVPPEDPQALAAALRQLIQAGALRRQLGAAGPTRARQLCDPKTQLARLEEVLGCLLS